MFSRRKFTALAMASAALPNIATAQTTQSTTLAMYDAQMALVYGSQDEVAKALEVILKRGNRDMIAGLIQALRFQRGVSGAMLKALEKLAGHTTKPIQSAWGQWMLWQEAHSEVVPHPSFAKFKLELFKSIDPNFEDFLKPKYTARDKMKIRLEEITWGGVRKDGIPSLDNPELVSANDPKAAYMINSDLVFGVAINGDVRAYPLRIMGWHEMFNAVIGGVPLALAYCTLCGSGILFETNVKGQDKPFVFGSSGFLYRSNKLMFDRQTNSLWNQFTGKPVVGPLVGKGIVLKQRPVVITTWADWKARNKNTKVITLNTGHRRNYGSGAVYHDYFSSPDLMFPTIVDQTKHKQKDYVYGIRAFGGAKAWPLKAFIKEPVINDAIGQNELVLIGNAKTRTVRAYQRAGLVFKRNEQGQLSTSDTTTWTESEEELVSSTGKRLARIAGHISYWFAWNGYLADVSEVYSQAR